MTRELLGTSEVLGRRVRIDPPASLASGTYRKIREALIASDGKAVPDAKAADDGKATDDGNSSGALVDFFIDEARIIFDIYTQWRRDIRRYLDARIGGDPVVSEMQRIQELVSAAHPGLDPSREAAWDSVCSSAARLKASEDSARGLELLDDLRERWRALHDGDVDFIMGLMDVVVRRLGEVALGEMYENWVVGDWFNTRYARFDLSKTTWEEAFRLIVYLSFEAMHGHLSGPERDGSIEYAELHDCVTFTFAPCGSGGRSLVGEPRDGLKPLMEAPFRYRALEQEHAFAWNKKGVCSYCAHCCVLLEKLPMEKFGYPIRVVDPPTYPNDGNAVCRWTVYRRIEDVPASVYERLGLSKPPAGAALGSAEVAKRAAPVKGPESSGT